MDINKTTKNRRLKTLIRKQNAENKEVMFKKEQGIYLKTGVKHKEEL